MSTIPAIDPRTGETVDEIPVTELHAIPAAAQAARRAQTEWFEQSLGEGRSPCAASGFLGQAEATAGALAEDCGRPQGEVWTAEIVANHELFGWWLGNIDDLLRHAGRSQPDQLPRESAVFVSTPCATSD